jgi:hypothetical protein
MDPVVASKPTIAPNSYMNNYQKNPTNAALP